ncbi:MAG: cytochrome c oxidase subunit 3 [Anaerolineales bacterium]|jgi:heme/copper-type cytochrome/quinol oxidase subunit 3
MTSLATPAQRNQTLAAKVTLWMVLASETALFATLVMSYLLLRTGQVGWPYMHPSASRLVLPTLNTAVLLVSAAVAWRSNLAIQRGDAGRLKAGLALACSLGILFIAGQMFEFTRSGMRPDDPAFGGVFFALMGFHGVHVLAGVVVLGLNLLRAQLGDFDQDKHIAVDMGTWFWYYVTAVWLVLFTVLYLI